MMYKYVDSAYLYSVLLMLFNAVGPRWFYHRWQKSLSIIEEVRKQDEKRLAQAQLRQMMQQSIRLEKEKRERLEVLLANEIVVPKVVLKCKIKGKRFVWVNMPFFHWWTPEIGVWDNMLARVQRSRHSQAVDDVIYWYNIMFVISWAYVHALSSWGPSVDIPGV